MLLLCHLSLISNLSFPQYRASKPAPLPPQPTPPLHWWMVCATWHGTKSGSWRHHQWEPQQAFLQWSSSGRGMLLLRFSMPSVINIKSLFPSVSSFQAGSIATTANAATALVDGLCHLTWYQEWESAAPSTRTSMSVSPMKFKWLRYAASMVFYTICHWYQITVFLARHVLTII